jgi:voltage-gated potassium channel
MNIKRSSASLKSTLSQLNLATLYLIFYAFFVLTISAIILKIEPDNFHSFFDSLWWVIVTISTVGYGDVVPHSVLGRSLAMVAILGGVIAVSLVTATLASSLIAKTLSRKKEYEMYEDLENHLIICGFRPEAVDLIEYYSELYPGQVLVINPSFTPEIKLATEQYKIKFLEGDFTIDQTLREAKVGKASKAVVLNMGGDNGDAKVLETVLELRSINKKIYVIAIIQNKKFENYLSDIHCDEIILSETYNKYLLTKSVMTPGISQVINTLLDSDEFIIQRDHAFTHKTYKEAFDNCLQEGKILLGIVENYLSHAELKQLILRKIHFAKDLAKHHDELEALKKSDGKKEVKLNPVNEYVIPENSALIIFNRRN